MRSDPTWTPTEEDYRSVLTEQNPWWQAKSVPAALRRTVERPLARLLWRALVEPRLERSHVIVGPRRVGKTTTMYQTVQRLLDRGVPANRLIWLRLDHPLLLRFDLGSLIQWAIRTARATTLNPVYLFLDELTYAREWDLWLKTVHDDHWPVRIAATSSNSLDLRSKRVESGIGRWDEHYLAPYLFSEYLALVDDARQITTGASFAETLGACLDNPPRLDGLEARRRRFSLIGGFPELLIAAGNADAPGQSSEEDILLDSQRRLRSDAVEKAVYKDIPQSVEIRNPELLERLLYVLGGQISGVMSPQNICNSLQGLSQPTFDRYLGYLERSFLVFTLQNYSGSEGARQRRGRKVYFIDGAVRNAALQRGVTPLRNPEEMGVLIENLSASHLHALCQQTSVRTFYWRDSKNAEVDIVYDDPRRALAFEIGPAGGHHSQGLQSLARQHSKFSGGCYLVGPGYPVQQAASHAPGSIPLELFLLAAGAHADMELQARFALPGGGQKHGPAQQ